jgi:hypothetical protein
LNSPSVQRTATSSKETSPMLTLWAYDNNQITLTERLVKHNWQETSRSA